MSPFEYVTVLIAIVVGLGITQILTGVADIIQNSNKVKLYWPHLLWVTFILLLLIQEWWVIYELKDYQPWRLPEFLLIMLYPVNLYILSRVLYPIKVKGKELDLKMFYFNNWRKIYLLLVTSAFLSIVYNMHILELSLVDQILQILLILAFGFVAIMNYTQEWLHKILSVVIILILATSIIIEWDVWLIE